MKKFKIIFIFFFFLSIPISVYSSEKIVFIDINFIFNNSEAGKDLQSQISKKNKDLQMEISEFKKEIEEKRKKILSQKNVLSVEEYNKKIEELEKTISDMNLILTNKRNEFNTYKKNIENSFSKNLNSLIEEFSVQNSIDIILSKENLLMAKKELDITEKIFNLFNERIKKIIIK